MFIAISGETSRDAAPGVFEPAAGAATLEASSREERGGEGAGRRVSGAPDPMKRPRAYVAELRTRLVGLGFAEGPALNEQVLADLVRQGKRPREAWRLAAGLSLDAAAARVNEVRGGVIASKNQIWQIEQWPRTKGPRPRIPLLRVLARVYGCRGWDQLVDLEDLAAMPAQDRDDYHAMRATWQRALTIADAHSLVPGGGSDDVIEGAASESAWLAAWAGGTNVDDDVLAELTRALRAIAHAYVYSPPLPLLLRTRALRTRVTDLLQGRQAPHHTRELYLLSARASALLAWMTGDLGNYLAAGDHGSAAWLCAQLADHHGTRIWVRATQSKLAYWSGDYITSAELAADGLAYPADDSGVYLLALLLARANARIGRTGEADEALGRWKDLREAGCGPDRVGGVLGLSDAQQAYLHGSALLELRRPADALTESTRSLDLFEATAAEQRFYGAEYLARLDAVRAHLDTDDLDGAAETLAPVLLLPPEQRLDTFVSGVDQVRRALADPRYRGSVIAQDLQTRVEHFGRDAIARQLVHR
jgi:hypothetical protein